MSEVVGIVYVFFFFQAEDGIRDLTVTGVQTCALPISHEPGARRDRLDLLPLEGLRLGGPTAIGHSTPGMDMNYNHNFEPGGPCSPNCGGGSGSINNRMAFAASPDTTIVAFDTYFFNVQARIPIRDPIIGPVRVSFDAVSNQQYLFALTTRGLVAVTLPSLTNSNPQAPRRPVFDAAGSLSPRRTATPKPTAPPRVPRR